MLKIYLFCNAGMSTSMLASMMQTYADNNNIDAYVEAVAISKIDKTISEVNPDVILLGPQVKYMLNKIKNKYKHLDKPIDVIDFMDYGNLNSEKVMKQVLKLLKNK